MFGRLQLWRWVQLIFKNDIFFLFQDKQLWFEKKFFHGKLAVFLQLLRPNSIDFATFFPIC